MMKMKMKMKVLHDDDEKVQDADEHDVEKTVQEDDDEEQTESDDDGDDFVHPKLTTHDDEIIHEEDSDEDDSRSQSYDTDNEGRDKVMTDVEDTHVTLTPVNPDGQQQSSSVSSGFVSNMLNPNQDTDIALVRRFPEAKNKLSITRLGFNFFYSTTGTIDSIKSILTQSALDALCEKFYIPNIVHPELPGRNDRIHPYPTPDEFDADVCNFLVDNPASFWKFPKPFLCFVGISRYYDLDENCYPTIWDDDDEGGMDLFAFIHHADPTKVRTGEKEVRDGEVSLLELTRGRIVPLTGVDEQENQNEVVQDEVGGIDIAADDEIQAIVVEKPKRVRKKRKAADGASGSGLPPKKLRENHAVEVGATTAATVPFVTSFVTLTPEREDGGHADSITGPNLRTQLAAGRFVVLSDSSHHSSTNDAGDEVTSVVPDPAIFTTAVATTVVADTFAPVHRTGPEPVPHSIFGDSASTGEANPDTTGPSHPAGTEVSSDTFFVVRDMDVETLQQMYAPKWTVIRQ
ncbi:hypothetical protein Tco_0530102 [Tanacetum coccineum]